MKKDNIIPNFKSEDEEREFWATHSPLGNSSKVVILQFREHLTCRSFLALVSEV